MEFIDIVLFLIIAYFAGSAASSIIERGRGGGKRLRNIFLGALGAFVGQVLLNALDINLGEFFNNGVTLGEIFVAFIGAVLVLFAVRQL
jgi:uncharacterized membrane protein YeaQ/YmgE (transglycosylase-associated protein family)